MGMYDDMNSTAQERHMVTGVGELEYYPIIKKYKWKSNLLRCNEMNPTAQERYMVTGVGELEYRSTLWEPKNW